jgi:hypothetical protein
MNAQLNNEEQPKQVPLGAVMAKLATNTAQRNGAEGALHYAEIKIRESKEGHIATLGRLVKYEGLPIIEEALDYAKTAGLFVDCDSKWVGVKTVIQNYTTKSGKTQLAHHTTYGKFLEYVKKGDEQPKSYKGYFLYKTYAEHLEQYRNNSVQSFKRINDLFDFTEKPVVVVAPVPEPKKVTIKVKKVKEPVAVAVAPVPAPEPKKVAKKAKEPKKKTVLVIENDDEPTEFVSVPAPSDTECGVKNGKIYIPLCRMGAIGKDGLLFAPVNSPIHYHPIPDKFDLAWFDSVAKRLDEYGYTDYHGFSFQRNIIKPNIGKIATDLGGISQKVKDRIENDCYMFLNAWFEDAVDEEEGLVFPCGKSFLMENVEY